MPTGRSVTAGEDDEGKAGEHTGLPVLTSDAVTAQNVGVGTQHLHSAPTRQAPPPQLPRVSEGTDREYFQQLVEAMQRQTQAQLQQQMQLFMAHQQQTQQQIDAIQQQTVAATAVQHRSAPTTRSQTYAALSYPTTPSSSSALSHFSPSSASPRILSIQSSVVYGYVGNKASVLPLQLLGFDVDPIHTCQLSNHTGYDSFKGRRTTGEEFRALIDGLEGNGMLEQYRYLLSGYMATVDLLTEHALLVAQMRRTHTLILYLCDPVMGDNGKLYVPADFVHAYNQLVQHADIVTPNQTELELLTDRTGQIRTEEQAVEACGVLHEKGVKVVIITSLALDVQQPANVTPATAAPHITILATQSAPLPLASSSTSSSSHPTSTAISAHRLYPAGYWRLRVPSLAGYWSGTGDLTSALLLGWLLRTGGDVAEAVSRAVSAVQAVMRRTGGGEKGSVTSELRLVESVHDLMDDTTDERFRMEWVRWKDSGDAANLHSASVDGTDR